MGFTANLRKRANMAVDGLLFLGGSGEAGGESAGKPDRIKTEGPGLNQHAHSKGLLFCGWLCHPDLEEKIVERWREGGERREGAGRKHWRRLFQRQCWCW